MEADDQEDTSYGGTKGDRDNSDFTQLESRSKDKAKVKQMMNVVNNKWMGQMVS